MNILLKNNLIQTKLFDISISESSCIGLSEKVAAVSRPVAEHGKVKIVEVSLVF